MSTNTPISTSVSRVIDADASVIYDLISDITRMPEFSPETVATAWIGGSTKAAVGARFSGKNSLGKARWSTKPTITAADRGRCFAFKVPGRSGPQWTYRFEPTPDGRTLTTESVDQTARSPLPIRIIQRLNGVTDRTASLERGMEITLDRLAVAAQQAAPAPATQRTANR